MSYLLGTSLRDKDGREYERTILRGHSFEHYADAREGCVPIFRDIALVADMLHDTLDGTELWVEIVGSKYGEIQWEMNAEHCTTLTALPF